MKFYTLCQRVNVINRCLLWFFIMDLPHRSWFTVTLRSLAQAGFRVVMPDAPDHGARFMGNEQARLGQFWHILHGSLTEFAGLRDALYEAGLVAENRLAVAGASMGGMTALGIMTRHPEVKSVACLMGSGYFTSLAKTLFPLRI